MQERAPTIQPVYPWDLWAVSSMSYANMVGVDPQFTALAQRRLFGSLSRLFFPIYLLLAGRGRKAVISGQIAGYAFLHLRRMSGVIFNVSVNRPFRRQGIGQMLLDDLQQIIRRHKRPWAALQVDWDNRPARALYEKIGFRTVHPHLWRGALPAGPVESGAAIEAVPFGMGRDLYRYYGQMELSNGESWAAGVLRQEYNEPPSGGRYWRCLWQQREVGCAWSSQGTERPIVRLFLTPDCWCKPAPTAGLLRLLAAPLGPNSPLRVKLGSSEHHAGAADGLRDLGFVEGEQERILMLKKLAG